jgi:ankyrin repeat protein
MKKRRPLPLALLALLLLAGVPAALLLRFHRSAQAGYALIVAIKADDTAGALKALNATADADVRDSRDGTHALSLFLSTFQHRGQGVISTVPVGSTALGLAVQKNNAVLVEALLARGATKSTETVPQPSPRAGYYSYDGSPVLLLMAAATNENKAIVRALAKHGWDMNAVDTHHQTALFYAGDAATATALMKSGTSIDTINDDGSTALDARVIAGETAVFKALLDKGAHDATALRMAVKNDRVEMATTLIDRGWSVDATNGKTGSTLLMLALHDPPANSAWRYNENNLHSRMALLLIQRGADVNSADNQGNTPLLLAATGGDAPDMHPAAPKIVTTLLNHGAAVNARDRDGYTPLMVATLHLRPALITLLLQHGAQVNARTRSGETALSAALRNFYPHTRDGRHAIVVRLLQNAGARK